VGFLHSYQLALHGQRSGGRPRQQGSVAIVQPRVNRDASTQTAAVRSSVPPFPVALAVLWLPPSLRRGCCRPAARLPGGGRLEGSSHEGFSSLLKGAAGHLGFASLLNPRCNRLHAGCVTAFGRLKTSGFFIVIARRGRSSDGGCWTGDIA